MKVRRGEDLIDARGFGLFVGDDEQNMKCEYAGEFTAGTKVEIDVGMERKEWVRGVVTLVRGNAKSSLWQETSIAAFSMNNPEEFGAIDIAVKTDDGRAIHITKDNKIRLPWFRGGSMPEEHGPQPQKE